MPAACNTRIRLYSKHRRNTLPGALKATGKLILYGAAAFAMMCSMVGGLIYAILNTN